jgi:HK97 family phage prohead protease
MPAIKINHTKTVSTPWDGSANTKNLKEGEKESYYRQMFAWQDPEGDPTTKAAFKFPHHEVSSSGDIGAANVKGCQSIISVLNGGMGGSNIPDSDRKGVWNHAAAHLKDAGQEPAELKEADEEVELRVFEVEMRAEGDAEPVIEGMAAVYNSMSKDLGGFRESIEPGFFENVLKDDVRALFNHNPDLVLGRTKAGTLSITDTERGLQVQIRPPDTQAGRDALTLIRRRDVSQMSFAFKVREGGDEWIKSKDGIRRVLKRGGAERLYDVSPVTYPAYARTSVTARSMAEGLTGEGSETDPEEERACEQVRSRHANRKREIQIENMK